MPYHNSYDLAREQSYPTPFQNSSLLPVLLMALAMQKHTPDTKKYFRRRYDYIVVGAGSAGSVVAGRLSEDPSKTVLLLEAGKSPPLLSDVPGIYFAFQGTDIAWNHTTEPQKYAALGLKNRRVPCSGGRAVGGTDILSRMMYVRGNREDYNTWQDMGAYGWDWDGVFPYFLRAEDNTDPDIAHNGYHARGGPLTVGRFPYHSKYRRALKNAAMNHGYTFRDVNGAYQSGLSDMQGDIKKGQRTSSAKAYLVPNENRPNLDIIAEAFVTKILISNKTAWGVQFDFEGYRHEVRARREVILSAGAIQSPQILMLSGIGPRRTLQEFDIPVKANLPVGRNLHDHPGTRVNFVSIKDVPNLIEKLQDSRNILEFVEKRRGILTVPAGAFGTVFDTDNETAQKLDLPDHYGAYIEAVYGSTPQFGFTKKVYRQVFGPYLNRPVIACTVLSLTPESRGYISIRSSNPYDPPVIDPQYYEVRKDVLDVVQGMKACYRLMGSPFMRDLGIRPFETLMPGCEDLYGDEYLECYARSFTFSPFHLAGSVKMGDIRDPETVVDSQLRVKGINRLRVVDASVMPRVTRGNTNIPVIMIAEKAADMIKKCH